MHLLLDVIHPTVFECFAGSALDSSVACTALVRLLINIVQVQVWVTISAFREQLIHQIPFNKLERLVVFPGR
jgi:hypothetical protein